MSIHGVSLHPGWPKHVQSKLRVAVSLIVDTALQVRAHLSESPLPRAVLKSRLDRMTDDRAQTLEEMRIKDVRMSRIPPKRRPQYPPTERLAILILKVARHWSVAETARHFLVDPETVTKWERRIDEQGENALLQTPTPVNRFPEAVRELLRAIKAVCPTFGYRRLAECVMRACLHLSPSTIRRILKSRGPTPANVINLSAALDADSHDSLASHGIRSRHPNHTWLVDLTTIPISGGLAMPWFPFSLPQIHPFCWWVAAVLDHYSRRLMGFSLFKGQPSAHDVCNFLDRAIQQNGKKPQHMISDKGGQFWCDTHKNYYADWCRDRHIMPRFGAVGKHGSISIIERLIGSMKREGSRRILVPSKLEEMRKELGAYFTWYNEFRPHQGLSGMTPNEVYFGRSPANHSPRYEPRPDWPVQSPSAKPDVPIKDKPGAQLESVVYSFSGKRHLPIIALRKVA